MTTTVAKEHGIIMSASSVNAILEGRKTQTRRVVKQQPQRCHGNRYAIDAASPSGYSLIADAYDDEFVKCPYQVGDLLWVRETWAHESDGTCCPDDTGVLYRATDPGWDDNDTGLRWRSPIYMPKWAARLWLEVIEVRVQRIQEICAADLVAEGMPDDARAPVLFLTLWDHLNAKRGYSWDSNPWVSAYTFKQIERTT